VLLGICLYSFTSMQKREILMNEPCAIHKITQSD